MIFFMLITFHVRCQCRILSIRVKRLHHECYSGCHIWLGQYHQHSWYSPIRIIRPRRRIQSWCSSIQHPHYLLCFRRWISSWPFLEALKFYNHLAWSHLFWHWHVSDRYIFSGTRSFAVEGSCYGRKGYAYLTDLKPTDNTVNVIWLITVHNSA